MTTATTSTGDVTIGARPTPSLYRVEVNPRNLTARRNLADPAQMHRRLMSLLPDDLGDTPRAAARLLYRLEKSREPVLLVQSGMPLDFDRLPAGWAHQIRQASLAGLLHTLQDGMQLQIRTRVSAVKERGKVLLRAGQRVSVHQPELREWWRHRADAAGLRTNDDLGWKLPERT
ncbi:MAG: type I-E CRISPR-associated protein Cas6/Cse3/CasE [Kineosporiaceae bacterium]|nr:type I-E CRISPR-associated protein Cas6/Cse3/CasE [Kineosporiaceae bacterium]